MSQVVPKTQTNQISKAGSFSVTVPGGKTTLPYTDVLAAAGAAGSMKTIPAVGTSFYLFQATGPVTIEPNGGSAIEYVDGTGLGPLETPFTSLNISNPSATPVSFTLILGFTEFIDKRLVIVEGANVSVADAPTYSKGYGSFTLAQGGAEPAQGTDTGGQQRRQLIVTNISTNGQALNIYDGPSGNLFSSVPAGTAWTVASDAYFELQNDGPLACTFIYGATFYS